MTTQSLLRIAIFLLSMLCVQSHMYVFSVQWTESYCEHREQMKFNETCNRNNVKSHWTIHGLWPSRKSKRSDVPFKPFTEHQIQELQLNDAWPSVRSNQVNNDFWKYEWCKHGRQAIADATSGIKNQMEYFRVAVDMLHELNLDMNLSSCSIKPRTDIYKEEEFIKCFKRFRIATSEYMFSTASTPNTSKHILLEIQFCYNGANIKQERSLIVCENRNTTKDFSMALLYPQVQGRKGYQ